MQRVNDQFGGASPVRASAPTLVLPPVHQPLWLSVDEMDRQFELPHEVATQEMVALS